MEFGVSCKQIERVIVSGWAQHKVRDIYWRNQNQVNAKDSLSGMETEGTLEQRKKTEQKLRIRKKNSKQRK